MLLEVIPASMEQTPILANLIQLYAHDFSEFHDVELGPDGKFIYSDLPLYWREPHRHPFLIMADGQLAGFVLLKRGSEVSLNENVWDVVEFFIIRSLRRRGIGTEIAHKVWRKFRDHGKFECSRGTSRLVTSGSAPSQNLWARMFRRALSTEMETRGIYSASNRMRTRPEGCR